MSKWADCHHTAMTPRADAEAPSDVPTPAGNPLPRRSARLAWTTSAAASRDAVSVNSIKNGLVGASDLLSDVGKRLLILDVLLLQKRGGEYVLPLGDPALTADGDARAEQRLADDAVVGAYCTGETAQARASFVGSSHPVGVQALRCACASPA